MNTRRCEGASHESPFTAGFEDIQDHVTNQDASTSSVIVYFERTYIGVPFGRNHTRREPPISSSLWSCHELVVNELPKTNNSVEAWHRSLQSAFGFQHPDPNRLIEALKPEQSLSPQKMVDSQRGGTPSGSKPYAKISQKLRSILPRITLSPSLIPFGGAAFPASCKLNVKGESESNQMYSLEHHFYSCLCLQVCFSFYRECQSLARRLSAV